MEELDEQGDCKEDNESASSEDSSDEMTQESQLEEASEEDEEDHSLEEEESCSMFLLQKISQIFSFVGCLSPRKRKLTFAQSIQRS